MSVNVHSALPPAAATRVSIADRDADIDAAEPWAETIITILATAATVLLVSFVAVMMAMT